MNAKEKSFWLKTLILNVPSMPETGGAGVAEGDGAVIGFSAYVSVALLSVISATPSAALGDGDGDSDGAGDRVGHGDGLNVTFMSQLEAC